MHAWLPKIRLTWRSLFLQAGAQERLSATDACRLWAAVGDGPQLAPPRHESRCFILALSRKTASPKGEKRKLHFPRKRPPAGAAYFKRTPRTSMVPQSS